MKSKAFFVDEVLEDRERSWHIRVRDTKTYLAKSTCERKSELEFIAPSWLVNKIVEAADRKFIEAA